MKDKKVRIARAKKRGEVQKFVEALRRTRGKGLIERQINNRGIQDTPAAYYGAQEEGFPVYTEWERDNNSKQVLRYLLGTEEG